MRLSFKIIIWFWVGLLILIGGLFYGAYSRLEPKTFIALLNEQAQVSYPGSHLSVGNIDYKFSVDFNLNLKDIVLRRGDKVLGTAGEVELRVPWWLLLFNRGNAQINLNAITIFVEKDELSTESPITVSKEKTESTSKIVKVSLPHYLTDAHYTLRAKNLMVKDIESGRRFFTLSKLLVREFQYGKNSAFEVNIPIEIHHKDTSYTSELWLFGDVTPQVDRWELNYRGEFRTKEATDRFQIEDLVIDGKSSLNLAAADVQSSFNLLIEKMPIGSGEASVKHDQLSLTVNLEKLPLSYMSLVGEEIKNPYLSKLSGSGEGFFKLSKNFDDESTSHLNGKFAFDGEFKLNEKTSFPGKWQLVFEDNKWETSFLSPKSEVTYFRRAYVDFTEGVTGQFVEELGFNGLEIQSIMPAIRSLNDHMNAPEKPFFSSMISFKKCIDGEKLIDANYRYGVSPEERYYQFSLSGDGAATISYQQKNLRHMLDGEFTKFVWKPYMTFLSPFLSLGSGLMDGKISGRWEDEWDAGQWLISLKSTELSEAKGMWMDLSHQLLSPFEMDKTPLKDASWNISLNKEVMKVTSFTIPGTEPTVISGQLNSDEKVKSFLTLSHPKNKKWKPVRKEVKNRFWKKDI